MQRSEASDPITPYNVDLNRLEELAKQTAPRDWTLREDCYGQFWLAPIGLIRTGCENNAQFIAAASPRTVLKLITRIRLQDQHIRNLRSDKKWEKYEQWLLEHPNEVSEQ